MRGRAGKRDYYNFKLRCDRAWAAPLMLPFESLKETRAASCPKHRQVSGVKVHRGFQDWGDVDTYEFQLLCLPVSSAPAKGALHGALASPAGAASEPARGVGWPGRGSALDVLSSTSLADLLTMSAEQVAQTWELVTSLLSDPPTVMQATFSDAGAEAREL